VNGGGDFFAALLPEFHKFGQVRFGALQGECGQIENAVEHGGVGNGEHFFYGQLHRGFGEDDKIVPQAEGFLHLFEAAHD
jgi:hypothetical protein